MKKNATAIVCVLALSGCATLGLEPMDAPAWRDRTTGEKAVIVGFSVIGVVAIFSAFQSGRSVCVGSNCAAADRPDVFCFPGSGYEDTAACIGR